MSRRKNMIPLETFGSLSKLVCKEHLLVHGKAINQSQVNTKCASMDSRNANKIMHAGLLDHSNIWNQKCDFTLLPFGRSNDKKLEILLHARIQRQHLVYIFVFYQ